mmetsp:Transcript_82408/g.176505  ORF Transcript_82408/g.176505 Transcript_82408/m.176505 type:complete len:209 (+) Transcript_82408:323-949(+)
MLHLSWHRRCQLALASPTPTRCPLGQYRAHPHMTRLSDKQNNEHLFEKPAAPSRCRPMHSCKHDRALERRGLATAMCTQRSRIPPLRFLPKPPPCSGHTSQSSTLMDSTHSHRSPKHSPPFLHPTCGRHRSPTLSCQPLDSPLCMTLAPCIRYSCLGCAPKCTSPHRLGPPVPVRRPTLSGACLLQRGWWRPATCCAPRGRRASWPGK